MTEEIYLAARYSRNAEMRGIRDVLEGIGYRVTSRWIDQHGGELEASYTPEKLNADPQECGLFGVHDMEDLAASDTVISFTSADGGGKGGRHVEHGLALGTGKRVIVCGPRENIFHAVPQVEHYPDWPGLARVLAMEPSAILPFSQSDADARVRVAGPRLPSDPAMPPGLPYRHP